jgi:hypothetical protein
VSINTLRKGDDDNDDDDDDDDDDNNNNNNDNTLTYSALWLAMLADWDQCFKSHLKYGCM